MKIEDIEVKRPLPGTEVRFIHSERMTIAHWHFDPKIDLPEHSHPHDQITTILEGDFELTVDGETELLGPGHCRVIPPDAVHSGRSITDCHIIDVFCPVRDDYR